MTTRSGQLDWLLAEFVRDTPGVVHGVVVSGDGLRLATSPDVGVALGDQLAAAASGLVSLARGTAVLLDAGTVTPDHPRDGRRLPVRDVGRARAPRWPCSPSGSATSAWSATR